MTSHLHRCPRCGTEQPSDALQGLCQLCVVRVTLGELGAESMVELSTASSQALFGDYELLEKLAQGGMGVVYRARQISLNRLVAVKMIRTGLLANESELERFRAEADAAASLDHPNIVPIYEQGEHAGQHYFAMKLMEGGSLAARIADPEFHGRGDHAARLVAKIARAIQFAHERGVLHRDLKPQNILIDEQDEPHVSDFGVAKRVESDVALTVTGAILGTPSYMSPEAAAGQVKHLTTASDIYSLGAILYELLTGQPPFRAETPVATLRQVMDTEPVRPRAINARLDRDLETICLKCLEKEAPRRYNSAAALADDLERFLRREPIQARLVTASERFRKWIQRRPARAAGGLALVLAVLLGIAGVAWQWQRAEKALARANAALVRAELESARARLQTTQMGRRSKVLEGVAIAARIAPSADLRGTAITALGLTDLDRTTEFLVRPLMADAVQQWPHSAAFNSDLTLVAWPLTNGAVSIVTFPEGKEVRSLPVRGTGARAVEWSPNDRFLAVRYQREHVVWDLETLKPLTSVESLSQSPWLRPATFAPDGSSVGWSVNGEIVLHELPSGARRPLAVPMMPKVKGFALHPRQPWIGIYTNRTVTVLELSSGKKLFELTIQRSVEGLEWSPDERVLVVMDSSATPEAHDVVATNRNRFEWGIEQTIRVAFSPDGKLFTSLAQQGGGTRLWDTLYPPIRAHTLEGHALRFSRDGQRIAFARPDGVGTWKVLRPAPVYRRLLHEMDTDYGRMAAFTADGGAMAVIELRSNGILFWDVARDRWVHQLQDMATGIHRLVVLEDNRVVTIGTNGVELWQRTSPASNLVSDWKGTQLLTNEFVYTASDRLEYSPALKEVVLQSDGREITLVHVDTQTKRIFHVPGGPQSLSLSPDGKQIAVGTLDRDGTSIHSTDDFALLQRLTPQRAIVKFSPDGRWLANYSATLCELWDTQTWKLAKTFSRATADANPGRMAFSPDGKSLLLMKTSKVCELVDMKTLESLAVFELPPGQGVIDVAFSPNGRYVAMYGPGNVHLYDLPALRAELRKMNLDW